MATFSLGEAVLGTAVDLDGLDSGLDNARRSTDSHVNGMASMFAGSLQTIGVAALAAAAAVSAALVSATIAISQAALDMGLDMDDALDMIRQQTGATGEELEQFRGIIINLQSDVSGFDQSASDLAAVLSEVRQRTGLAGDDLEAFTADILNFTRIVGGDAAQNTELLTRALGDWSIPLEESGSLMDRLTVAAQRTGVPIDSLLQNIVRYGSPLRLMGFGIDDTIAMFAKWEQEGVNAELVVGSLRIAAGEFARQQIPLQEGLRQTVEQIQGMEDSSAALALGMDVFGARAGPDMVAAIREGRFEFEDLAAAIGDSTGALDSAIQDSMGVSEQWQMLMNRIRNETLLPLGERLLGAATIAFPVFERAVDRVLPILQAGADVIGTIADFVAQLAVNVEAGVPFWEAFANTWDQTFGQLGESIPFFEQLGPIVDGIAAFGLQMQTALEPIFTFIAENVELSDVLIGLGVAILSVIIPAIGALLEAALPIIAVFAAVVAAVALLRAAWENDFLGIRTTFEQIWENLQPAFNMIRAWFEETMPPIIARLTKIWEEDLRPAFERLGEVIQTYIMPLIADQFNVNLNDLGDFLDLVGAALEADIEILGWLVDNLVLVINAVSDFIQWLNAAAWTLDSIHLPSWLTPGSPTPLELGVRGIDDAMRQLTEATLPALSQELMMGGLSELGASRETTNYNSLTINSNAPVEPILQDYHLLRAMSGAGETS